MLTLFMPWLRGWRQRMSHVRRGHLPVAYWPEGRWDRANCECGDSWLESTWL